MKSHGQWHCTAGVLPFDCKRPLTKLGHEGPEALDVLQPRLLRVRVRYGRALGSRVVSMGTRCAVRRGREDGLVEADLTLGSRTILQATKAVQGLGGVGHDRIGRV